MRSRNTNWKLGLVGLGALVGTTGCEVALPLLVGELEGGDDVAAETAELSIEVSEAEGMLAGQALDPTTIVAQGDRAHGTLSFRLQPPMPGVEVAVQLAAEGSADNPYIEGGDGFGRLPEPGIEGAPIGGGSSTIQLCSDGLCEVSNDFELEVVETAEGRLGVFDGTWESGEHAHFAVFFEER